MQSFYILNDGITKISDYIDQCKHVYSASRKLTHEIENSRKQKFNQKEKTKEKKLFCSKKPKLIQFVKVPGFEKIENNKSHFSILLHISSFNKIYYPI